MKLILHIGMGKTGTSAIQKFLNKESKSLLDLGILYTGTKLSEVEGINKLSYQGEVRDVARLKLALSELEQAVSTRDNVSKVIWSNESFSQNYNYLEVSRTIREFVEKSAVFTDVDIILVLRRQDEWLESAYRQWGLKHKMYSGRKILSLEDYSRSVEPFLDYLSIFRAWSKVSYKPITVVEYGEAIKNGGMVRFIAKYLSIDWKGEYNKYNQVHRSLGPALSYLTATYNSYFDGSVRPEEFGSVIKNLSLQEVSENKSKFISEEFRVKMLDRYRSENNIIAKEAMGRDELFSLEINNETIDYPLEKRKDDIIKYLLIMARQQHVEISNLKKDIYSLDRKIESIINKPVT